MSSQRNWSTFVFSYFYTLSVGKSGVSSSQNLKEDYLLTVSYNCTVFLKLLKPLVVLSPYASCGLPWRCPLWQTHCLRDRRRRKPANCKSLIGSLRVTPTDLIDICMYANQSCWFSFVKRSFSIALNFPIFETSRRVLESLGHVQEKGFGVKIAKFCTRRNGFRAYKLLRQPGPMTTCKTTIWHWPVCRFY